MGLGQGSSQNNWLLWKSNKCHDLLIFCMVKYCWPSSVLLWTTCINQIDFIKHVMLSFNFCLNWTNESYPTKHRTRQIIHANVPVSYCVAVTTSAWQWGHLVWTGASRNCWTTVTAGCARTTVVWPCWAYPGWAVVIH